MKNLFSKDEKFVPNDKVGGVGRDETTRHIAKTLLWGFVISLVLLFVANLFVYKLDISSNTDLVKGWFDLLKNALILLGTALTTVIGYYFGQREGALKAEQAEKKVTATEGKAERIVNEALKQRNDAVRTAAPTTSDPKDIDTPPANEDGQIQLPPTL